MGAAATGAPAEILLMGGMLWVADGEGFHIITGSWVLRLLTRDVSANNIYLIKII